LLLLLLLAASAAAASAANAAASAPTFMAKRSGIQSSITHGLIEALRGCFHMRAAAVAAAASGALLLLLLLCCIASKPTAVSLYQPHYAPSNFRQGPRQFSPYSYPYETGAPEGPQNNLPPVYSPEDVAQGHVWTGYNYLQPVFASYSNPPAAVAPVPFQPRRIQSSSRYDDDGNDGDDGATDDKNKPSQREFSEAPVIMAELRRSRQRVTALEKQVADLKNVVEKALKQPISPPRQRRQIQISSRHDVPVILAALRRSRQRITALERQVADLKNALRRALKQPILRAPKAAPAVIRHPPTAAAVKAAAAAAKVTAAADKHAIQTDPSIFAKVAKAFSHRMTLQQMMRSLRDKLQLGSEPDASI